MSARSASEIASDLRRRARVHPELAKLLNEAADRLAVAALTEAFFETFAALREQPANLPEVARDTPADKPKYYWVEKD